MSSSRGGMTEKGARYLGQLDQALCNGNWAEIPELARKTEKHAPDRKCESTRDLYVQWYLSEVLL